MVRFYLALALFLLSLLPYHSQAQSARRPAYRLAWKGVRTEATLDGKTFQRLDLAGADHSTRLPKLVLSFEDKTVSAYRLENPVWRPLTSGEKALIDTAAITAQEQVVLHQAMQARKPVSIVRITPFRRSPVTGQLEKLLGFDPAITYGTAAANARTAPKTGTSVQQDLPSYIPFLASGNWYRVGVTKSGIYKLTGADLRRMGMNLSSTRLAIVGGQGSPLTERIYTDAPEYLRLWSVSTSGLQDGTFNDDDYALFYAEGVDAWSYDAGQRRYRHINNIYADTAYYFVSLDAAVQSPAISEAPAAAPQQYFTSYSARHLYEKDQTNLIKAGKLWLGETFDFTLTRDFTFETPNRLADSLVRITVGAAAVSYYTSSRFDIKANNVSVSRLNLSGVSNPLDSPFENRASYSSSYNKVAVADASSITVNVTYTKGTTDGVGYLDYIEVEDQEALRYSGNPLSFRQSASAGLGPVGYQLSGLRGTTQVWNVTNAADARRVTVNSNGQFGDSAGAVPSEFVAFDDNTVPAPILLSRVPNQNLVAKASSQLIIVTHPNFLAQAERLAAFRRSHDQLTVEVVTTNQIFNEFSGGKQDLAGIRNFVRWQYLQPGSSLRYLLLFGDCSFDYRSKQVAPANNTNFVTIYERPDSFNPVSTWASDDFFSCLDKGEGGWDASDRNDIGVGRLTIRSTTEAENIVDKMIDYSTNPAALGAWRNVIAFVADNGDGLIHMDQSEDLSNQMEQNGPAFNPTKIFLPAYPRVAGPGGLTSPELKAAIRQRLADGALAFNYTGHGSEFQWADEKILDPELINELDNAQRLPFFITATCEFGRLDDPSIFSSAENLVIRPGGGAIGVFSACRPVYSFSNYDLNKALYRAFFTRVNGELPRLGDIYLITKNTNSTRSSNYPFILFADPSLRLNYPENEVIVTAMTDANGQPIDTVGALSTVRMQGEIRDLSNNLLSDYKGTLQVTFYDKKSEINVTDDVNGFVTNGKFSLRKNIIFNGTARITDGKWQITFQLPLDINYTFGQGKLSMYARPDDGLADANGYRLDSLIVGGSSSSEKETNPPVIALFMNDTTFRNGGTVSSDATFIARLNDDSGINVSQAGIGHEMTAIFSYESGKSQILNDYYITDAGDARKGMVRFPLKGLKPGSYSVTFKAWDLHNNSATSRLEFVVREGKCPEVGQVAIVPNPMQGRGEFQASLSQPGGAVSVSIDVYDMVGRKISTLAKDFETAPAFLSGDTGMNWRGTDANGILLRNGTYIYRLTATAEGGCRSHQVGRLVINR